jgi:coproporphyrinogen III oxidase-like Fe-S oxidoreductase
MRKRQLTRKEKMSTTASAAAVHIVTQDGKACTVKQCMKQLLDEVKKLTGNLDLTITQLKESLQQWVEDGWAKIKGDTLEITRAGRNPIKQLAEASTVPT